MRMDGLLIRFECVSEANNGGSVIINSIALDAFGRPSQPTLDRQPLSFPFSTAILFILEAT